MLKRNIFDDEDAVSEVVGTILILSITVVLFSSIFATVSHLETPDRRTYTEMNASYRVEDENHPFINITHQGGKSIEMDRTTFFVVIDGNSDRYTYEDEDLKLIDGDDDTWDIGEDVEIDISELVVVDDEIVIEDPIAEILVSDNVNNQIIWDTELSLKPLIERPRIKEAGIDYKPEWRNYVERGEQVDIYAKVTHPNVTASNMPGDITVTVNLSELNDYNGPIELEHHTMNEFRKTINITSDEEEKTYHLEVEAKDNDNPTSKAYINLNVGPQEDVKEQPNILVDDNKIHFNPSSPTSGESLRVDAVIENDGGSRALVNVTFWDERPNGDKIQAGVITNLRVAAGGGRDISATWNVNGSGEHKITVDVTDVVSPGGENYRDLDEVKGNGTVYVKPSILVVDDVPMGTREASSIRSALSGADFSFDDYQVGGPEADGPSLNDLERYDLTIWLTGGAEEYTLTDEDINTLEEYLDNGNYLWFIGENIDTIESDFIEDYMGISKFEGEEEGAPGEEYLNGTGILENITLPVNQDVDFNGDYLEPNNDAKPMMIDGLEGSNYVGITHNNSESDYRVATNSIQLQSIQSGHSTLAYRVIKWLANMEHTSGRDIAISEQSFSTRTPMYQEEMEVSATLRNNGPVEETVDVRLYVNDRLDTSQREQVVLGPDGDSEEVSFEWTAQPVGSHDLVIKADPFDRIDETNELNNDIKYSDFDTTINVQYSVLIVDADESVTDANKPNTTQFIENRIESLGYAYDYYQIEPNEDRPDSQLMSNYNSVYWVVGNSTEDDEGNYPPLTEDDVENIKSYLNNETFVSFYLEGHRVIKDLRGRYDDFLENYLGVDLNSDIYKLDKVPDELNGVNEDDLSHGMDYLVEPYESINEFYGFEVGSGSPTLRDQDGNIVGSRYENEDDDFRTMLSGVGLAHIAGPNVEEEWYDDFSGPVNTTAEAAREEYVYMMSKWFGNEDERVELRVSDMDIEPETEHPILGRSYLLTASIQNVGFTGSNALIRFKDGDSLIASDSIYVSGDSFHTAEVSWQPSFAGSNRPIRVLVDPMQNVAEIGNDPNDDTDHDTMGFNNHAMISQPVYYFWDDMENGTDNWDHESTIANINGEQSLGYLSEEYENVYTDVEDEWDGEMSHNVTETDQFSHSDPNSYWMAEPMAVNETVQEEVPIDVVMAIDTSGSMHWAEGQDGWNPGADDPDSRMYQAVEAAIGFIEDMNEEDRLEIWTFDPYGSATPHQYLEFAEMNDGNKEDFIDDLEAIREGREGTVWEYDYFSKPEPHWGPVGGTPYYDTLGYAIESATEINEGEDNDRLEFVIGLADGEDNTGDEYDQNEEWGEGGLLNAPPMVYNIGLVGEALHPEESTYPEAPYWDKIWEDYADDQTEEEMYHVGNTTPTWDRYGERTDEDDYCESGTANEGDPYTGRYYFAKEAEDVGTVFEEVRNIITQIASEKAEEGEVTSVPSPDGDGTESSSSENAMNSEPGLMQTELLPTESFEGSFPPAEWDVYKDGHQQSNEWGQTSARANSGSYSVWHKSKNNKDADGWLVTPQIDATSYTDVMLEYYDYTASASDYDYHGIYVSTSSGNPGDGDFVEVQEMNDVTNSWQQRTVDLSSFDGTSFYLAFRYEQWNNKADDWYVDDVTVLGESDVGGPSAPSDPIPNDGATGIATDAELSVYVEHEDGSDMDVTFYDASDDSLIETASNVADNSQASVTWSGLDYEATYEWYAVADDGSQTATSATWSFTTLSEEEDGDDEPDPIYGKNENKTAVTPSFNLTGYDTARLSFMQKYRMVSGTNGGFLMVGWEDEEHGGDDGWAWRYVDKPSQGMYNGNLNLSVNREDDFGNEITYAYNGVSGGGSFDWEHIRFNILNYVPEDKLDSVRVKFNYTQYGSGTGYGWYLDDVQVTVSRDGHNTDSIEDDLADMWHIEEIDGREDGKMTTAWMNLDPSTGYFKGGIDNSLVTTSIDLTNARTAYLSAYFKFNINEDSGVPPDGFRVEITTDGGRTWMPLNVGVRSSYGVSGTGEDGSNQGANFGNKWTTAGSLSRLETDLSDFSGNVVRLRFRVVTTNADNYAHYEDPDADGGFYVDDVVVSGSSTVED